MFLRLATDFVFVVISFSLSLSLSLSQLNATRSSSMDTWSWWYSSENSLLLSCDRSSVYSSVTRWLFYFSIFCHWKQWKFAQLQTKFVKVGSKVWQILNKLLNYCQNLLSFCQSGKNSPNLVTLVYSLHSSRALYFEVLIWNIGPKNTY